MRGRVARYRPPHRPTSHPCAGRSSRTPHPSGDRQRSCAGDRQESSRGHRGWTRARGPLCRARPRPAVDCAAQRCSEARSVPAVVDALGASVGASRQQLRRRQRVLRLRRAGSGVSPGRRRGLDSAQLREVGGAFGTLVRSRKRAPTDTRQARQRVSLLARHQDRTRTARTSAIRVVSSTVSGPSLCQRDCPFAGPGVGIPVACRERFRVRKSGCTMVAPATRRATDPMARGHRSIGI